MKLRHILTAAAATFALATSSAAFARDYDHDRDHNRQHYTHHDNDRHDGNRHEQRAQRHSYRSGYSTGFHTGYNRGYHRAYVSHDRIRFVIRSHNYRYVSDPYWYRGYYVVRAYDPYGRLVLVRVDPYSGAWLGIAFRL